MDEMATQPIVTVDSYQDKAKPRSNQTTHRCSFLDRPLVLPNQKPYMKFSAMLSDAETRQSLERDTKLVDRGVTYPNHQIYRTYKKSTVLKRRCKLKVEELNEKYLMERNNVFSEVETVGKSTDTHAFENLTTRYSS